MILFSLGRNNIVGLLVVGNVLLNGEAKEKKENQRRPPIDPLVSGRAAWK